MDVYNLHTMKIEESVSSPLSQILGFDPNRKNALAVALGSFDGVHAGHTELISRAVEYANTNNIYSAVWTFKDDSSALPKKNGRILTTLSEKLSLIASLGVDYALLEDFSHIRDYSPERFVNELLIERCSVVCAVCGFNFSFGKYGLGNCDTLRELMSPQYKCIVVPPVYKDGHLVSSSAIRLLIEAGETEKATTMLGRPFSINFPVVHGKQLGRTIGIPTINQDFPLGHIIPKTGIYACTTDIGGDIFLGVSNVGLRPTVDSSLHHINCETHIINYNGWLYGKDIKVSFYKRLRDEIKFPSIDELKLQIEHDIKATIDYFSDK